jgi:L-seryl-tRNA(Ser) seleniumtransferase
MATSSRVYDRFVVDPRRLVPHTDTLLADPALAEPLIRLGRRVVKDAVAVVQDRIRAGELPPHEATAAVLADLPASVTSMQRVLNATGTVLHTNLGRAQLSAAAVGALQVAAGATDVELDLDANRRARRGAGALDALTRLVPEAQAVHVVNNGAAAIFLAAVALAAGRDIVVSRGELVEIGDGFRIPELLEGSGAHLREVGTTNRTSLRDYEQAIDERTAFVLKVHPSNFTVEGFTSSVSVHDLHSLGVPVVADIGSGLLVPEPLLPDEPDATTTLKAGADLVTASGDKLLGGPQCGLLLGSSSVVETLRRHPVARALRVDKLTLAALEATLRGPQSPTWLALHADPSTLRARAEDVAARLRAAGVPASVVDSAGVVGGGGAPGVELAGSAIALHEELARPLRTGRPAVLGRIEKGQLLLDLRCIDVDADAELVEAIVQAAAAMGG